jgi:chemotaxis protein methyltransferase WspC
VTAQTDFETLLKETMGLDPVSVGSPTIERAVRLRMSELRMAHRDEYWQRVRGSEDELQELIEAVVVPETWFFRDREAFVALARLMTEEWLPAHRTATLRLLSVPCSTGEEPYSMVMALLDAGFPGDRIKVDAVDISARALELAGRGEYGLNSFRGGDMAFRERYFQNSARGYSLAERLHGTVTFRQGNLLASEFALGQEPYDVIFCRNLLIYFDRSTQERIMRTLGSLLGPTGFLFVGGAETFLAARSGFTSVNQAMSFAFRKASADSLEPADPPPPQLKPIEVLHPRTPHTAKVAPLPPPVPSPPVAPACGLATARKLADAGRLREAAECCESHIQQQGPSSGAYYLLGLVRDALGDRQSAAECYRKLLYLEPEHVEALMHLSLLTESQGDSAAAQRLRERVRRIESRAGQGIS